MTKLTFCFLLFAAISFDSANASGNHPEAGACSVSQPYFAICTHSLHNLDGWFGKNCHTEKDDAQREAQQHADKYHQGNMRWTGISQFR
jgi:hypothetical protein